MCDSMHNGVLNHQLAKYLVLGRKISQRSFPVKELSHCQPSNLIVGVVLSGNTYQTTLVVQCKLCAGGDRPTVQSRRVVKVAEIIVTLQDITG